MVILVPKLIHYFADNCIEVVINAVDLISRLYGLDFLVAINTPHKRFTCKAARSPLHDSYPLVALAEQFVDLVGFERSVHFTEKIKISVAIFNLKSMAKIGVIVYA